MRAYIFWHYPTADADRSRYEAALAAFHGALAGEPSDGFIRSSAHRIEGAAWLPGGRGYEDWYEVRDSAALDPLDRAAVAAAMRSSHDAVAGLAGGGAGGLYRLLERGAGTADPVAAGGREESEAVWLTKPPGAPYREVLAVLERLSKDWSVWQRQMVLGPAPEFCLVGPAGGRSTLPVPPEWPARVVARRRVWPLPP